MASIINLLIYLNPEGFDEETKTLAELQIDNSLELGWEREDLMLVTDFAYEYNGVKAQVVDRGHHVEHKPTASKMTGLVRAFDHGLIGKGIYWCHDLDAYQQEPITEGELGLDGLDAGFCDYTRNPRWQLGSFFFKKAAEDIFRENVKRIAPGFHDEMAMVEMTDHNVNDINNRIKRLNGTYDFGMRRVDYCYERADKPIKVLHFHPRNPAINTLRIAMYGRNSIRQPLMTERLIRLFNKYGYK